VLFAADLLLAAFFFWLLLELCPYPTATAAHTTAAATHLQTNPDPLVTAATFIRLYGARNVSASTPLCHPNHHR
jgi:hypothetical protein